MVTKTYKRWQVDQASKIDRNAKVITGSLCIENKAMQTKQSACCITLKNHKSDKIRNKNKTSNNSNIADYIYNHNAISCHTFSNIPLSGNSNCSSKWGGIINKIF